MSLRTLICRAIFKSVVPYIPPSFITFWYRGSRSVTEQSIWWANNLVSSLSLRMIGFRPKEVHVTFVMDKVALWGKYFVEYNEVLLSVSLAQYLHLNNWQRR